MEPRIPSPNRSPELPSVSPHASGEIPAVPNPETRVGGLAERREQQGAAAAEQTTTPPISLPVATTIALPTPPTVDPTTTQPVSDSPTIANDDELIEKEWVDKAKKVIAATKDDPYQRERQVSQLQAEYLSKRYGRELGSLQ